MPKKQLRPCVAVGCRTLVYGGRCEEHKRDSHPTSKAYYYLYNNAQWRKYRALYLNEHPFCISCGRRSYVVDHIKDHKGDVNLFWDEENHQPMCKRCHDAKTARENLGGQRR